MVVIGIDEAGRGCWAGPLVAAAVYLQKPVPGLRDSKKLSRSQRQRLATVIEQSGLYATGLVEPAVIDQIGLTKATRQAMLQAWQKLQARLSSKPGPQTLLTEADNLHVPAYPVIIDGHINYLAALPQTVNFIKADAAVPAVMAAGIIAKLTRDRLMNQLAGQYPDYGFDKHVGYGTALHAERLRIHGPSPQHRLSYRPLQKIVNHA